MRNHSFTFKITGNRLFYPLKLIGFRLQNSHIRQIAVTLVEIQPIAYDKFIGYLVAYVISVNRRFPAGRLVKQGAKLNAFTASLFEQVFHITQGVAAIDNILHNQDMAVLDRNG